MAINVANTLRGSRSLRVSALLVTTALVAVLSHRPVAAEEARLQGNQEQTLSAPQSQLWGVTPLQLAQAGDGSVQIYDIPAQPLASALAIFGQQSGLQVTVDGALVRGLQSPAVTGEMTSDEAVATLLAGSDLTYRMADGSTIAIEKRAQQTGSTILLDPVTVAGTGASPLSDIENLPSPYAGGQVARGARIGVLGNQDMMDTPFSATGYTEQAIRNQQAESIADVMANDPSVRSGYGFGNFSELFVVRGFPLAMEDVSMDGLYGTTPRQIANIDAYERVEVFRGASAFVNGIPPGSTGTGGTINLVPKRAEDTPITSVTGKYGMTSEIGGHADVGRRFGSDNAFGIRVNLSSRDGETAIDDEERTSRLASAALDYRGEKVRLTLDTLLQSQRIDKGRPVVNVSSSIIPDAPDASTNYGTDYSFSNLEDRFIQMRGEYDVLDSLTLYGAVGYRFMREDGIYASPTVTNVAGDATIGRLDVPREDQTLSGQFGGRAQAETGDVTHQINAGMSAFHTVNRNSFVFGSNQNTNIYNPVSVSIPNATSTGGDLQDLPKVSESWLNSYFLSDTLGFVDDQVLVTLGARHQTVKVKGYNRTSLRETSNYNESKLSPVVGLVIRPTEQISLYANRIEGLAQGPTAPTTAANTGEVFPPYVSVQYEAGVKLDYGTIGGSAAVFQTSQPSGITDPTTNVFGIDGEQRNRGIELLAFGDLTPDLHLLGGVTYTQAELSKTAGGNNDGNFAVGAPQYQANMGVEWDLPYLSATTLSARMIYTGTQYQDTANAKRVPEWSRLDIGARTTQTFDGQDVTFRANIENVTNNAYWASVQGGYLTQGAPLTGKLSVSTNF